MFFRLFISIQISDEAKDELIRVQSELKKRNSQNRITWVNPEVMHITLHFIGKQDEQGLKNILEDLENVQSFEEKPKMHLDKLCFFPNRQDPRVIAVEAHDSIGSLKKIQQQMGECLNNAGLETDQREFKTHITLGRLKNHADLNGIEIKIKPIEWKIDSFELMESQLNSDGPKYSIIKSFFI